MVCSSYISSHFEGLTPISVNANITFSMAFQLLHYVNTDIQMLSGENLEFIQIDPCTQEFCLSGCVTFAFAMSTYVCSDYTFKVSSITITDLKVFSVRLQLAIAILT